MTQESGRAPSLGWTVLKQSRVLLVLVICSVVFLAVGVVLAQVVFPKPPQREPVQPGLITAKVESRVIVSTVVARADVSFADPVAVEPAVPEGASDAVVTGHVPKVGDVVESGAVLLEVSGRPVFALGGKFPAFRSLAAGMKGPDVTMLRSALKKLGYSAGKKSSTYDAPLANAVAKLYTDNGYTPPGSGDKDRKAAVRDAEDAVADADTGLKAARKAWKSRTKEDDKDALRESLRLAQREADRARERLAAARQDALTQLPASEVVFLTSMPRRVDAVNVRLGTAIGAAMPTGEGAGAPLVLSGNKIKVVAQVVPSEAALLAEGAAVAIEAPGDVTVNGTVSRVCEEAKSATASADGPTDQCAVEITLGDLTGIDRSELLGNVQATIHVGSSGENSLVVPVAAVSADSAGRARVQRVAPGSLQQNGDAPATEWITFQPGVSAEGFVEVTQPFPNLAAGDLVVLGVTGSQAGDDPAATDPPR